MKDKLLFPDQDMATKYCNRCKDPCWSAVCMFATRHVGHSYNDFLNIYEFKFHIVQVIYDEL